MEAYNRSYEQLAKERSAMYKQAEANKGGNAKVDS